LNGDAARGDEMQETLEELRERLTRLGDRL